VRIPADWVHVCSDVEVVVMKILLYPPLIAILCLSTSALADRKSDLEHEGWRAVAHGTVDGTFNGCNYNKPIPLRGGGFFVCKEYNYEHAYSPDIYEMRKAGSRKYVIDGKEFKGHKSNGSVTRTKISGEFKGCKQNRVIHFDNGMLFQCKDYHYHYAFHPEVVIVFTGSNVVTIDGEEYAGTLFRH
jgi:hypothetical protein